VTLTRQAAAARLKTLTRAAECLKTLAHPIRLRIVEMLLEGEYTVGELAEACRVSSPVASGHLGVMRDRGLLGLERRGQRTYYHVRQRALAGILSCVRTHFGSEGEGR
jgi:DNA-binding transcriptional ArsR family regulator